MRYQIQKYEDIIDKTRLKLTLFEALTMIYLLAANDQKKIDYNICEAGAGFEADSTNLWEVPEAQIITNINLQHLDLFKVKTLEDLEGKRPSFQESLISTAVIEQAHKSLAKNSAWQKMSPDLQRK